MPHVRSIRGQFNRLGSAAGPEADRRRPAARAGGARQAPVLATARGRRSFGGDGAQALRPARRLARRRDPGGYGRARRRLSLAHMGSDPGNLVPRQAGDRRHVPEAPVMRAQTVHHRHLEGVLAEVARLVDPVDKRRALIRARRLRAMTDGAVRTE
jgi:hypothetical protein